MTTIPKDDLTAEKRNDVTVPPGIVAINVKGKITKLLEDNRGEYLYDQIPVIHI